MLSAPAVHKLFFFLSILFGMETSMVSQESELMIDREAKTGRIAYREILAPKDRASDMASVLQTLDGREQFDKEVEGLRFTMSIFRSKKGSLAVDIFFEYEDEKAVQKAFGLDEMEDGSLAFQPAERDSVLSSNGERNGRKWEWPADVDKLRLELAGEPLDQGERREMVLVKYIER